MGGRERTLLDFTRWWSSTCIYVCVTCTTMHRHCRAWGLYKLITYGSLKMATRACCWCNRKGLCKGYGCVKSGAACSNCLSGCLGECHNQPASTRKLSVTHPRIVDDSCLPLSFPTLAPPIFSWGNLDGEECCKIIDDCYNEAIHWRHNLFRVLSGSTGNSFVSEVSCLIQAFGEESS